MIEHRRFDFGQGLLPKMWTDYGASSVTTTPSKTLMNDACMIKLHDGRWHIYGIKQDSAHANESAIHHFSSTNFMDWVQHPDVVIAEDMLDVSRGAAWTAHGTGTMCPFAPDVIENPLYGELPNQKRYVMALTYVYRWSSSWQRQELISLLFSDDGFHWTQSGVAVYYPEDDDLGAGGDDLWEYPVGVGVASECRDPAFYYDEANDDWYLFFGIKRSSGVDTHFYASIGRLKRDALVGGADFSAGWQTIPAKPTLVECDTVDAGFIEGPEVHKINGKYWVFFVGASGVPDGGSLLQRHDSIDDAFLPYGHRVNTLTSKTWMKTGSFSSGSGWGGGWDIVYDEDKNRHVFCAFFTGVSGSIEWWLQHNALGFREIDFDNEDTGLDSGVNGVQRSGFPVIRWLKGLDPDLWEVMGGTAFDKQPVWNDPVMTKYDNASVRIQHDTVNHLGVTYECIADALGRVVAPAGDPGFWAPLGYVDAAAPGWVSGGNYYERAGKYVCIDDVSGSFTHPQWDAAHWTLCSTTSVSGSFWVGGGTYTEATIRNSSDCVTYNGVEYRCTGSHVSAVGNEPDKLVNWEVFSTIGTPPAWKAGYSYRYVYNQAAGGTYQNISATSPDPHFGRRAIGLGSDFYHIDTYESRQLPWDSNTSWQEGTPVGWIRSKPFTIQGNRISLYVGGGLSTSDDCFVGLIDEYERLIFMERGSDSHTMTKRLWDTTDLIGSTVRIVIVDNSTDRYRGWISCNSIVEYAREQGDSDGQVPTLPTRAGERRRLDALLGIEDDDDLGGETLLEVVNDVLRDSGELEVPSVDASGISVQGAVVKDAVNDILAEMLNQYDWDFAEAEGVILPEAGRSAYLEPADFDRMVSWPLDHKTADQLRRTTPRSVDAYYPAKTDTGTPYWIFAFGGALHIYPTPDDAFVGYRYCMGTDGKIYRALVEHTASGTSQRPVTGSDWQQYWERTEEISSADPWTDGREYIVAAMPYRYMRVAKRLTLDSDRIPLPDKLLSVLKAGCRQVLKAHLEDRDADRDLREFYMKLQMYGGRRRKTVGRHRMRMY